MRRSVVTRPIFSDTSASPPAPSLPRRARPALRPARSGGGSGSFGAVRVERPQRVRGRAAERPDHGAVVDVVDLAGAVVELELLQRGERVVALLDQRAGAAPRPRSARRCSRRRRPGSRRNGSATSKTASAAISAPRTSAVMLARVRVSRPAAAARARRARARRASRTGRRCRRPRSGSRAASRAP